MLEATGLCQGAWVLAALHKSIAGFKRDEVYIGTAEERRAKKMGDDTDRVRTGAGHPMKLPIIPAMDGIRDYDRDQIASLEADLTAHLDDVEQKLRDVRMQKGKLEGKAYQERIYGTYELPESLKHLSESDPAVMEYIASIRKSGIDEDAELGEA
eukprot:scaffold153250_cov50-Attheya_sp.AAC.1